MKIIKKISILLLLIFSVLITSCVIVTESSKSYITVNNESICFCEYINGIWQVDKSGNKILVWTGDLQRTGSTSISIKSGEYAIVCNVKTVHNPYYGCPDLTCSCQNCKNNNIRYYPIEKSTSYKSFSSGQSYTITYDGAGVIIK